MIITNKFFKMTSIALTILAPIMSIASCSYNYQTTITGIIAAEGLAFSPSGCLAIPSYSLTDASTGDGTSVYIYAPPSNGSCNYTSAPVILGGLHGPSGVAFSSSGCLAVANTGTQEVYLYAAPSDGSCTNYSATPTTILTGFTEPTAVAFSPSGCLAVADGAGAQVYLFAPPTDGTCTNYSNTPATTLTSGFHDSNGVAFSPNGCLFVTDEHYGNIYIYAAPTDGSCTNYAATPTTTLATGFNTLKRIAFSSTGCFAVPDAGTGNVHIFTPPADGSCNYTLASSTLLTPPPSGFTQPFGVAFSANGCLAVSDPINDQAYIYTTVFIDLISPLAQAIIAKYCAIVI